MHSSSYDLWDDQPAVEVKTGLEHRGTWSFLELSLVGGLEHFLFSHILGIIIPID